MKYNQYNTLIEAIAELNKQGYREEFYIANKKVIKQRTNKMIAINKLEVDQFHKVEGMSDPADGAIVIALTTSCGYKGLIIDGYGPTSTQDLSLLTQKIA